MHVIRREEKTMHRMDSNYYAILHRYVATTAYLILLEPTINKISYYDYSTIKNPIIIPYKSITTNAQNPPKTQT